jgi:hypothetical protein
MTALGWVPPASTTLQLSRSLDQNLDRGCCQNAVASDEETLSPALAQPGVAWLMTPGLPVARQGAMARKPLTRHRDIEYG